MRNGIFKLVDGVLVEHDEFRPDEAGTWVFGTAVEVDGVNVVEGNCVTVDMRPRDWTTTRVKLIGDE